MFERFTDNARTVMQLANQNAQRLNHEHIGTEHILLALVEHGTGVAITVLTSMAIDVAQIPSIVESLVQEGSDPMLQGKLPRTPGATKVIELAMEKARSLEHHYVGTEHLLLGMLRADEGIAARALAELRVDLGTFRNNVLEFLDCPEHHARNDEYGARNEAFARQRHVGWFRTCLGWFRTCLGWFRTCRDSAKP